MTAEQIQTIVSLITGITGLISAAITAFFAVKTFIKSLKDKSFTEIWNLIMTIADAAMKEAEASTLAGEDKKKLAIDTVKAGCEAAGIDITAFIDQLDKYIDSSISFANGIHDAKKK